MKRKFRNFIDKGRPFHCIEGHERGGGGAFVIVFIMFRTRLGKISAKSAIIYYSRYTAPFRPNEQKFGKWGCFLSNTVQYKGRRGQLQYYYIFFAGFKVFLSSTAPPNWDKGLRIFWWIELVLLKSHLRSHLSSTIRVILIFSIFNVPQLLSILS